MKNVTAEEALRASLVLGRAIATVGMCPKTGKPMTTYTLPENGLEVAQALGDRISAYLKKD